ncbi:molybdate ABC transporter substrate-binding protein [Aeromicrobium sp. NPDC092404]|uniref:molybdate ABC transporter substrate-binding protein n=1 Tax=Aeromicrobium sp. NPDC092404 TaxID=3154976 RepID=UPI0034279BB0
MRRLVVLPLLLACLVACGTDDSPDRTTITVFAAASLKGSFTEIGRQFEAENDDVSVTFSFAGSADLVAQIQQGAPADVFASADTRNMDKAMADGLVAGAPVDFAKNSLEIATPPGNPAEVDSLDDLVSSDVRVVVCAAEVPCGAAAVGVEKVAGIDIRPVSEEQSVADVLGKVISGEADAGLVYVTDVKAAGDQVRGVPFPESADVVNTYPIATLAGSKHAKLARAFAAYVAGPDGAAVLAEAGFATP